MVRTAKVAICNREGREGRGEGGCRRCRRGIAAFEEIPTSGRNYPTANSRTVVDDDDQVACDSYDSCVSFDQIHSCSETIDGSGTCRRWCQMQILREFRMSTNEDNGDWVKPGSTKWRTLKWHMEWTKRIDKREGWGHLHNIISSWNQDSSVIWTERNHYSFEII